MVTRKAINAKRQQLDPIGRRFAKAWATDKASAKEAQRLSSTILASESTDLTATLEKLLEKTLKRGGSMYEILVDHLQLVRR